MRIASHGLSQLRPTHRIRRAGRPLSL